MAKKAVLIGVNYPGTHIELKGCANDVNRMYNCLVERFGFPEENIKILIDIVDFYIQPTGRNIRKALAELVDSAKPGDILFVHYSGHGTRLPAETGDDDDTGYDECIVPSDMNLITDDDFRELVDRVPEGCQLTIVSDSCHSGGLIDKTKEQIGESTKQNRKDGEGESAKQNQKDVEEDEDEEEDDDSDEEDDNEDDDGQLEGQDDIKNKSLPLSSLIKILKQKTGKDDIDVGKLRPTLFDVFGDDSSPKIKKFVKYIFCRVKGRRENAGEGQGGAFMGVVGGLAMMYLEQKLQENDEEYAKPALETSLESEQEAYAGAGPATKELPDGGILISGCQTDQTSADATPSGDKTKSFGAFSNAVQIILEKKDQKVSNKELVTLARKLLHKQGFKQCPGLYCHDDYVNAPFIC